MIRNTVIAIMALYIAATWTFVYNDWKPEPSYSQEDTQAMNAAFMPPRLEAVSLPPIRGINQ